MKKITFALMLLVATFYAQAQSYYVCNSNGTALEIPVGENVDITFDAQQRLVRFNNKANTMHSFATVAVDSIALVKPSDATNLSYSTDIDVAAFDADDANSYNEITETIITDELNDESGDFLENYSPTTYVTITFSENGVTYTPSIVNGVTFTKDGAHLTIDATESKIRYMVKGNSSNGSLKIYSLKKFQLMLAGLNLTNPNGPAINIQSGKTVYFSIGNNTENTLCDGATYAAPTIVAGVEEDQKGTLFSEGQLIFSGTGTLNVRSLGGHAICSDDYIRIRSGNINITGAAKDGFHTNDIFRVGRTSSSSPVINVTANGDGIDCGKGEVVIEAGDITLNTVGEAIKVSYEEAVPDPLITPNATIKGGFIKAYTGGNKGAAIKTTGNFIQEGGIIHADVKGDGSKIVNCDGSIAISGGKLVGFASGSLHIELTDTTSAGGIKSNGDIVVNGGTIAIKCTGKGAKAMNSDNNIRITNGDITLLSTAPNYQDAIDDKKSRALSGLSLTHSNGTLLLKAYDKAISVASLTQSGGIINAISTNDVEAINVDAEQTGGWLMTKGEQE